MDDDEIDNWNKNTSQNNNQNPHGSGSSPVARVDDRLSQVQIGNKRERPDSNSPSDNLPKKKKPNEGSRGPTPTDDNSISKEALRKVLRHPMETKKLIKKLGSKYPRKEKKEIAEELKELMAELQQMNKVVKKPVDGKTLWQW